MNENELQHYGVLGMKWGVRRDRSGSGSDNSKGVRLSKVDKNIRKQQRKRSFAVHTAVAVGSFAAYEVMRAIGNDKLVSVSKNVITAGAIAAELAFAAKASNDRKNGRPLVIG